MGASHEEMMGLPELFGCGFWEHVETARSWVQGCQGKPLWVNQFAI